MQLPPSPAATSHADPPQKRLRGASGSQGSGRAAPRGWRRRDGEEKLRVPQRNKLGCSCTAFLLLFVLKRCVWAVCPSLLLHYFSLFLRKRSYYENS